MKPEIKSRTWIQMGPRPGSPALSHSAGPGQSLQPTVHLGRSSGFDRATVTTQDRFNFTTHGPSNSTPVVNDAAEAETMQIRSHIPEEGKRFRLEARETGYVLYSRPEEAPLVGHYHMGSKYPDQVFTLVYGKGEHQGLYVIKSWYCGKVLFSRTTFPPYVGNIYGDGEHGDNWFRFVPDDRYKDYFRIYCPTSNTVLFSRTHMQPEFANFVGDKYDDQLWRFVPVDG